MRKIINSTYITLDGAVADPQDWPSLAETGGDESYKIQWKLLNQCDAVLMGRHTYESFAAVWPTRSGDSYSEGKPLFSDMGTSLDLTLLETKPFDRGAVLLTYAAAKNDIRRW